MNDVSSTSSHNRDDYLAAAEALVPVLRERAGECEAHRTLLDETVQDFHRTGLFRIHQPARVGGSELDLKMFVDAGAVIARGCPSSSWNLVNLGSHHWMLAMWPAATQDEIWDADPDALIASSFVFPAGKARKADGGYLLNGRWPYSSGVDNSSWNMLAGLVEVDDGPPEARVFLLPARDYTVIDTWHAAGLRGTGSKDVECQDIFVPENYTVSAADMRDGTAPGTAANPGPLYRIPTFAVFPYILAGVALGAAEGALETYIDVTGARVGSYTGAKLADQQVLQVGLAEAASMIDAAGALLRQNADAAMAAAIAKVMPDLETRARWRRDAAYATGLCRQALTLLFEASGAAALYDTSPMQRYFRDIQAICGHAGFSMNMNGATWGRVALGLPSDNPNI
jgi:3-hydroxy-9,10-secoandrosta-1,3,5(10)-triene-9,17-dione monooxygenase